MTEAMREGKIESFGRMRPGQALLAAGYIGLHGTAVLASERRELLEQRFAPQFVRRCQSVYAREGILAAGGVPASELGGILEPWGAASWCLDGEGGILAALWDYFEAFGLGFELELRRIPVLQETVEVCEALEINPYRLWSGGCALMTADDGAGLLYEMEKRDIPAVLLGRTTREAGRRLHNGEIHTWLDRPGPDELRKVFP